MVSTWESSQPISISKLAKQIQEPLSYCQRWLKRHEETGSVEDAPKQGRKRKLEAKMLAAAQQLGEQVTIGTSRRVATKLEADFGVQVSPRTVRRNFSEAGMVWESPTQRPLLTKLHKATRLQWAQKHLRCKTSFAGWMFTDSKIFLITRTKGKNAVKCWHPRGKEPVLAVGKTSVGIHVYMGVTKYGCTQPIVVTGAGGKKSEYLDPKTGKSRPGVCAEEYVDKVIPQLIAEGNALFSCDQRWASKWVFQQDGAPVHTAKLSKQKLAACMPNRVAWDWPAGSPDLSWIEKVWGWLEERLQPSAATISSVFELEERINQELASMSPQTFMIYVKGMKHRLEAVLAANGDSIGK